MKKYGLVLAGGGAKGAYQIGAWKALREMGIEFSEIAGVSIGSINGALIASDNFDGALELWEGISVEKGVNISVELPEPNNLFSRRNFAALFKEIVRNGGIDASPTKELLSGYISESAVRNSKARLAIVAFHLSNLNPLECFIENIPEGQLLDYLLASSHVPGVSKIGPEGERYLDGGVYDNAPISFLRKNGCNRLLIIDISSMKGIGHKQDISNAEIVYIRPYNIDDLGAAFDFSTEMFQTRLSMGYLDTKKAFGELLGRIFYFEPPEFMALLGKYGADTCEQLEAMAYELDISRLNIYSADSFMATLSATYEEKKLEEERREQETEPKFYETIFRKIASLRSRSEFTKAVAALEKKNAPDAPEAPLA